MKYPKTIKFRVLQRDIDKAAEVSKTYDQINVCRECIIAQAAKRIINPEFPNVISVGSSTIRVIKNSTRPDITLKSYSLSANLKAKYVLLLPWQWSKAKPSKTYILTAVKE